MRVAGGAIPYTTVHGTEVRSHARERASLNDVIHEQAVAMTQGQPARYEGWQGGVHCGDMCTSYGGERQLQRHERLESEPLSLVTLATRVPRSDEADQDSACAPVGLFDVHFPALSAKLRADVRGPHSCWHHRTPAGGGTEVERERGSRRISGSGGAGCGSGGAGAAAFAARRRGSGGPLL